MKKYKLSPVQLAALEDMLSGCNLYKTTKSVMLIKGRLAIQRNTFQSLLSHGLIEKKGKVKLGIQEYKPTKLCKTYKP